jgi:hypothetical protein
MDKLRTTAGNSIVWTQDEFFGSLHMIGNKDTCIGKNGKILRIRTWKILLTFRSWDYSLLMQSDHLKIPGKAECGGLGLPGGEQKP